MSEIEKPIVTLPFSKEELDFKSIKLIHAKDNNRTETTVLQVEEQRGKNSFILWAGSNPTFIEKQGVAMKTIYLTQEMADALSKESDSCHFT